MQENRNTNLIMIIILISLLLLLFASCDSGPSSEYIYQLPENIGDGLEVGSLDEVGIDQELIGEAINNIDRGKFGEVHSMLIYKDGKLVVEEYFDGHKYQWDASGHHGEYVSWNRDMLHCIHSDTKSITSVCIGLAIDNGFIESVNQSIFDYLPEYQHLKIDGKDSITIENLLTMTSGFEWDEWNSSLSSTSNDTIGIWFSDKDPITFVLERPLVSEPGTSFNYNGGNTHIMSQIINNSTGLNLAEFSEKYLFEPLGIDSFEWWLQFDNGLIGGAGSLKLTPRDMIKVGATFLNNGQWNGKQVISEKWVEKTDFPYPVNTNIKIPGEDLGKVGYSYTWWTKEYSGSGKNINMYWANGWGGQKFMVLPEINTVVVFTGATYTSKTNNFKILDNYIVPAIE